MILRLYEFLKIPEGRPIRFIGKYWRKFIDKRIIKYIETVDIPKVPLNKEPREKKVIASLTSFPARIDCAYYAIKSLMLQDYKPDRIVLWLAKEEFENKELPSNLLSLQEYGLEIKYCENLRGHKKYFELLKNQSPNELIITYDDDIIYPHNSISLLMKFHKKYPNAVITNRGYEITFDKDKSLRPHKEWRLMTRYGVKQTERLVHMSNGSGVLYPYGAICHDAWNSELIRRFALGIDDLWMTVMTILGGSEMVKTHFAFKTFTTYPGTQKFQLGLENMRAPDGIDKYDTALKNMIEHYPSLKERMTVEYKEGKNSK